MLILWCVYATCWCYADVNLSLIYCSIFFFRRLGHWPLQQETQ